MKRFPYMRSILLSIALVVAAYSVTAQTATDPDFYQIKIYGVEAVDIRDRRGSVLKPLNSVVGLVLRGEVEYDPGDSLEDLEEERRRHPNLVPFFSPHEITFLAKNAKHEIRFRTTDSAMMKMEIRKSTGLGTNLLVVYGNAGELGIRRGINARINFTPTSLGELEVDNDGNGSYETTIQPRLRAVGQLAKDEIAPRIRMTAAISGKIATVTVSAVDGGVGVHDIRYMIGHGNPLQRYTKPFEVDISGGEVLVFVAARDRADNYNAEFKYFESGREKIGHDPHNLRGNPPGIPKTVPNNSPSSETDPFQLKSKPE